MPRLCESGEEPADATLVDWAQPRLRADTRKTMVEMHEPRKCLFGDRDSVALKEEHVEERQHLVAPLTGELTGMADRRVAEELFYLSSSGH